MKKLAIVLFTAIALPMLGYANCGNGPNDVGNGCSGNGGTQGPIGPQGPTGPQGLPGTNGKDGNAGSSGTNGSSGVNGANGANGTNGVAGKDGKNGTDTQIDNSAKLVVDTAVRLYDGKYVQLQAFNTYAFARHDAHDVFEEFGNSRNFMFGARIVFKLGSSYEERLVKAQNKKMEALEAALARMQ